MPQSAAPTPPDDLKTVSTPRDGAELDRLGRVLSHVFRFPPERVEPFIKIVGDDNFLVVREGAEVAGGLCLVPMGQWFGGRRVSMAGVAAVGVAPHQRAKGVATRLMRGCVREMHARGFALSALYPATQPLYRRVGYEQAGSRFVISMRTADIDTRDRALDLRPIEDSDFSSVETLYRRYAKRHNGLLDRGEYIWRRVYEPKPGKALGYLIERDGEPEGYLYSAQADSEKRAYDLWLSDFVALTPDAARRGLTFMADHRSMTDSAKWAGSPLDPAILLLTEKSVEVKLADHWMLRVVDVARALEERGYAPGVACEFEFEVFGDAVLPEVNEGGFRVRVADGRAKVERIATPAGPRIHLNGLAALYTGHLSGQALRATGLLEADFGEAASLSTAFAGAPPFMPDAF